MSYEPIRIAILGVGSVKVGPAVIFSLATYFGESKLELFFWDPDEERLDLLDLLARKVFDFQGTTHSLKSSTDPEHVREFNPQRWIVCLDPRSNRKQARSVNSLLQPFIPLKPEGPVLNLMDEDIPWIAPVKKVQIEPTGNGTPPTPHQILRWINGEEYAVNELRAYEKGPIHSWIEDPNTLLS